MWFRSLFDGPKTKSSPKPTRRMSALQYACRPRLETLEDRLLPSFSPALNYAAGLNPRAVVTADFNGDGHLDLAADNDDDVSVLLGRGDGSFQPAVAYDTGYTAGESLAAGDFNSDGKLDIALAGTNDVRLLFGNGDGSFQPVVAIEIGSPVSTVAVGDLNSDTKLDLVVLSTVYVLDDPDGWESHYEGFAHVLLGDASGNFAAPLTSALGGGHGAAVLVDVNGDGALDLAACGSTLDVFLNDGAGHFQAHAGYFVGYSLASVAAGDIDEDENVDLVAVDASSMRTVALLVGDGVGGFGPPQYFSIGSRAVMLRDFNNDSHLDITTTSDANLSVLLGRGDATFLPRLNFAVNGYPCGLVAGDFNSDGWLDAVTGNDGASNGYPDSVAVLINDHAWPRADEPVIRIFGSSVTEGNAGVANAPFTVTLSKPWSQPATVEYYTAGGTAIPGVDYQPVSGTLTFAPGQTSLTAEVPVYGDRTPGDGDQFFVGLRNPSNATIEVRDGYMSIVDDEPRIRIVELNDVSVIEGNSGVTHVLHYTVTKSIDYDLPVTVTYGGVDGTATTGFDYQTGGTLTFAPGEFSKTIDVTIYGDRYDEETIYSAYDPYTDTYNEYSAPYEYFSVALTGSDFGAILQGAPRIYIQDDDEKPTISISDMTRTEGKRGQTTLFTFTVTLSAAYDDWPVTLSYRTVDDTAKTSNGDYVAKSGTLTFAAGETSKTITIEVKGDSKREADEYFYLDLFGLSSNALFTKNRGIGTILNDD